MGGGGTKKPWLHLPSCPVSRTSGGVWLREPPLIMKHPMAEGLLASHLPNFPCNPLLKQLSILSYWTFTPSLLKDSTGRSGTSSIFSTTFLLAPYFNPKCIPMNIKKATIAKPRYKFAPIFQNGA